MKPIDAIFQGGSACIAPVVVGDPDLSVTFDLALALAQAGADAIELHLPFSDPTAEGALLQKGALRALAGSVTAKDALALTQKLSGAGIPSVLRSYANVVFHYGAADFAAQAAAAGACALHLFDVPLEERGEFEPFCRQQGLALLSSVSTGSVARVAHICRSAQGYLLCEKMPGEPEDALFDLAAFASQHCALPLVLEFQQCTPELAARAAALSASVSLGDAIAALVDAHGAQAASYAAAHVAHIKAALRGA